MSEKAEEDEVLKVIYKPNGKAIKVNSYMVKCLKSGAASLSGYSLEKPKES
jgi:hypothetical protein